MAAKEINLKCTFLTKGFNSFNELKASDIFTDVTLVTDDSRQIKAHKIILSAGSEFFRNLLSDKSHPHFHILCCVLMESPLKIWPGSSNISMLERYLCHNPVFRSF